MHCRGKFVFVVPESADPVDNFIFSENKLFAQQVLRVKPASTQHAFFFFVVCTEAAKLLPILAGLAVGFKVLNLSVLCWQVFLSREVYLDHLFFLQFIKGLCFWV